VDGLLLGDDALDELRRGGARAGLGADGDVVAVDAVVGLDLADGRDDRLRERLRVDVTGTLAGHRRGGDPLEPLVVELVVHGDLVDGLAGEGAGLVVALDDGRRVDVVLEQVLGLREQLPGQDRGGGRAVADFLLLRLGDLDDHLGGGVLDVHLAQDGRPVVRDDDVAVVRDEHLVHAARAECRPYGFGDRFAGVDVRRLCVLSAGSLGVLRENHERLSAHATLTTLLCHSRLIGGLRFYIKLAVRAPANRRTAVVPVVHTARGTTGRDGS